MTISFKHSVLMLTAALVLLPLGLCCVYAWRESKDLLDRSQWQAFEQGTLTLEGVVNDCYYRRLTEQYRGLINLRIQMSSLLATVHSSLQEVDSLHGGKTNVKLYRSLFRNFSDTKHTVFLLNQDHPERSIFYSESDRRLLHALNPNRGTFFMDDIAKTVLEHEVESEGNGWCYNFGGTTYLVSMMPYRPRQMLVTFYDLTELEKRFSGSTFKENLMQDLAAAMNLLNEVDAQELSYAVYDESGARLLFQDDARYIQNLSSSELQEARLQPHLMKTVRQDGKYPLLLGLNYQENLGLILAVEYDKGPERQELLRVILHVVLFGIMTALAGLFFSNVFVKKLLDPLQAIIRKASQIMKVDLHDLHEVENIAKNLPPVTNDEIGELSHTFGLMSTSLSTNISILVLANAAQKRLEGELGAAREIQMGMLPGKIPQKASAPYATDGLLIPAKEVGGDLYDICPLPGGRLGLVIGDVSDKGVPAALFMTMTVTLIREGLALNMNPGRLMNEVNLRLAEHNPNMMFVTLFIGVLERRSGRLTYANGGHCQPLVFSSSGEVRALTGQSGPVVGALPECSYEEFSATLKAGEGMLLYTDGVSEAQNEAHELFGEERIKELLRERHDSSSTQLLAAVEEAVERFRGAAAQSDDITMVALTPLPKSEPSAAAESA